MEIVQRTSYPKPPFFQEIPTDHPPPAAAHPTSPASAAEPSPMARRLRRRRKSSAAAAPQKTGSWQLRNWRMTMEKHGKMEQHGKTLVFLEYPQF